jgi:hypothetical protein
MTDKTRQGHFGLASRTNPPAEIRTTGQPCKWTGRRLRREADTSTSQPAAKFLAATSPRRALPVHAPRRIVRAMVDTVPLAASGPREPAKPKPIPAPIRGMIRLMVYGRPDDPNCAPVPLLEAGRQCGVSPDQARKYLDRANVRQLLMAERRAWRAAISAGNEGALQRVRDKSSNGMATVAAVRALEQLEEGNTVGARGQIPQVPGFVIVLQQRVEAPPNAAPGIVIEGTAIARAPTAFRPPVDQA